MAWNAFLAGGIGGEKQVATKRRESEVQAVRNEFGNKLEELKLDLLARCNGAFEQLMGNLSKTLDEIEDKNTERIRAALSGAAASGARCGTQKTKDRRERRKIKKELSIERSTFLQGRIRAVEAHPQFTVEERLRHLETVVIATLIDDKLQNAASHPKLQSDGMQCHEQWAPEAVDDGLWGGWQRAIPAQLLSKECAAVKTLQRWWRTTPRRKGTDEQTKLQRLQQEHPCLARPAPGNVAAYSDSDDTESECEQYEEDAFDAGFVIATYRSEYGQLMADEWPVSELTLIEALREAKGDLVRARRIIEEVMAERELRRG